MLQVFFKTIILIGIKEFTLSLKLMRKEGGL
jgi:hypothetical protein